MAITGDDHARFAESHGFDLAMTSDHVAPTPDAVASQKVREDRQSL
jgi:hypothetical protein